MEFRPCIDIHNGAVKQIVGSSIHEENGKDAAVTENFVSEKTAADYAKLYQAKNLKGGHVILLNKEGTEGFAETQAAALSALAAYPGGLQIGGGIRADNALSYIKAGASHVIVTSYVFSDGRVDYDHLKALVDAVGKEHLVLDLSCKKVQNDTNRPDGYYIVTDRWQKLTEVLLNEETLDSLAASCSEFLIHAVDVEGKNSGIEEDLVKLLSAWNRIPITYAGGVHALSDIKTIKALSGGNMNVTVGSALDLFGGSLSFERIIDLCR